MTNPKHTTGKLFALILAVGIFANDHLLASESSNNEEASMSAQQSGELYLASDDAMSDVASVLDAARENNKLALVIMGANWCHDSRGLASRLYKEPLHSLVNEYYETLFVDVGFLDKGKDVINSLGASVYYATPTVLIIDPVSGVLVNENNRHQWANAYDISMADSVTYFQKMADTDLADLRAKQEIPESLQRLLEEIRVFEQIQAERLYAAYAVLGPLLEEYENGNKPDDFENYWGQIRKFRYKVPGDVEALRVQAAERVAAGEQDIRLDYPKYPPFSWETSAP